MVIARKHLILHPACFLLAFVFLTPTTRGQAPSPAEKPSEPAESPKLRDITDIEILPPKEPVSSLPLWLSLIAALSLGGFLLGWKLGLLRTRPAAAVPSDKWALNELDHIDRLGLPPAGKVERYHTLISDVVRRYLDMRFGLAAPKQTTAEFLETMRHAPELTEAQQGLLRDFLERCDLAKFARAGFTVEECQLVSTMARELVAQTAVPAAPRA